ncbi:hypothetical protein DSCW_25390 [Desulfosarcina widdelii]|uniref:PAC domain-containing protein n=1 Tax=Desulfosarcina widdelii TaxID=947919 RepID=A0A5K7YZI4_9BACT|nr:PAS domain S-box protein [Desulfosarcina widdelii]BBO75122.1 hypothetical protein DSCW_25390 [Desulfosarcina widdelii]
MKPDDLKKKLADCSRLLKASHTGLISLDKAGLIEGINVQAVKMLGADRSLLLKKPISLFIAPEDQSVFYINRSRIFSGELQTPFEIKLKKKDGTLWFARVNAQPLETPNQRLPGMLLAVEDISPYRQAVESLQFKEDFINLLFSIIDDLAVWSTADIDEIIFYCLEKVGLLSKADRVYVCLFHNRGTRLTVTHEWTSEGIDSPSASLQDADLATFSALLEPTKNGNVIAVEDLAELAPDVRAAHQTFHAAGIKSLIVTPLFYGHRLLGVIGCDAVRQTVAWPRETCSLIKCVGGAIVNALLRRRLEETPAKTREPLFRFIAPTAATAGEDLFEYEGPIEVIDSAPLPTARKEAAWHIEAGEPDAPADLGTALLKDGKTANVACRNCNRQKLIDISEIRTLGTRIKVTCVCGNEMFFKVELRREHRKTVNLEGVFIRGPGDRIAMKSDDWGGIQINNLSRNGIGFKFLDNQDIRVKDRFRVKFALDNTARSVIQKEVVVRSVNDGIIGCQFTSTDACDVTLGFYMLT